MRFILAILLILIPSLAQAQKRVALVIGNDQYDNLGPKQQLQRAVNDARSVSKALTSLDFQVITEENVNRATFNAKWQMFLEKLAAGDTAAVFFSGHGVEIEGLNYLLPRDVPNISYGRQEQLKRESLSVPEMLLDLRSRRPKVSLIILDACRDHPLIPPEYRSAGRGGGLARMEASEGTFIMYSAGAGETALDRLPENDPDKLNSVYTRKLLPLMARPALPLHELARELRSEVSALTATVPHRQRPAYYDGLIGKFCLAGCEPAPAPPKMSEAERSWRWVKDTTSPEILENFIKEFGGTPFGALARARLDELKRQQVTIVNPPKKKSSTPQWMAPDLSDLDPIKLLTPGSGQSGRDCWNEGTAQVCGPEMVVVPPGSFMMGSPSNEAKRDGDEEPRRRLIVRHPFAVGKFEVTFAEWEACVDDGGCRSNSSPNDQGWGKGRRPVINVSWHDVKEYVTWLSQKTRQRYRLLSEAEWEYVARAGTSTPFSTGQTILSGQANFDGTTTYGGSAKGQYRKRTVDVGSFPPNQFGLRDIHGNVWEWVEDCWHDTYEGAPNNVGAWTTNCTDAGQRVTRGGSWVNDPEVLRSANRNNISAGSRQSGQGFRVARTLGAEP